MSDTPQGFRRGTGNVRADIPDASIELNNRGASKLSRILLKHVPGSDRFKTTERTLFRTSLSCVHYSSVMSTIRKGYYTFKIDLDDAYFHVPIHPDSRKYLSFAYESKVYQFQVFPFFLTTAPQVFTRLGHTVAGYLHRQEISLSHISMTASPLQASKISESLLVL